MFHQIISKARDVYEKVIASDGIKSQRIDIHYKFIGYLDLKAVMGDGVWCRDEAEFERDGQLYDTKDALASLRRKHFG